MSPSLTPPLLSSTHCSGFHTLISYISSLLGTSSCLVTQLSVFSTQSFLFSSLNTLPFKGAHSWSSRALFSIFLQFILLHNPHFTSIFGMTQCSVLRTSLPYWFAVILYHDFKIHPLSWCYQTSRDWDLQVFITLLNARLPWILRCSLVFPFVNLIEISNSMSQALNSLL